MSGVDHLRPKPRHYPGVMVSSTFEDLKEHRIALMRAIEGQQLHAVGMEQDSALPTGTVVEASMTKVRRAAAYVGVISHRYGQVPECAENPDRLSLTELEFHEARRIGLPILIFIMGPSHPVLADDVEHDPDKRGKLDAFREEAKRESAGGVVHRVYRVFNSLADFSTAATQSLAELRTHLNSAPMHEHCDTDIPAPPALYAQPSYIGSHTFVGRRAQLATLDDWADAADQHPVLFFESIGGAGKSMLSWEWITNHATGVRGDWAGRFWYSFYEKGAVMTDFCRRALAYTTRRPIEELAARDPAEIAELLMRQLKRAPWLFVLDGLERVLAAYQRYDATQLLDEHAGKSDDITDRDPRTAARPEDDEFLRQLAGASPSKILITSRLVPSVLLNASSQPIPGVLHERLPGLRAADAEALLRSCEVTGDSAAIRAFLKRHCDCHPLVTGIVAGLINDYLPARGDFDAWAADPHHGGHLNLAKLDLVQKRNHILRAALAVLAEPSWQLLSTLALLSETVDYETLSAFNPHLAAGTEDPEEQALAVRKLSVTVHDLELRGLLQYDRRTRRYDIHPVVRGVAAGGLLNDDLHRIGQRMVDHFSARADNPHDEPESLDDLRHGMTVVRTLVQLDRIHEAALRYLDLGRALVHKLEAFPEVLSLLQPFFLSRWLIPHRDLTTEQVVSLASDAACAMTRVGEREHALALHGLALTKNIDSANTVNAVVNLANAAMTLDGLNRLARADNALDLALELAELHGNGRALFVARLAKFERLTDAGAEAAAEKLWQLLDIRHSWDYAAQRSGQAEIVHAHFKFRTGRLTATDLASIENHARVVRSKALLRKVHRLRGNLLLELEDWTGAARELGEAMRMTRTSDIQDADTEGKLALARLHSGHSSDARREAERLSSLDAPAHLPLAQLWLALGEHDKALEHALQAHRRAWADGEPHVRRYDLREAALLLHNLGTTPPQIASYDPATDPHLPWEAKVRSTIFNQRHRKG